MPEKQTLERARRKKREGRAPTTQAGEFVREEMHHAREGKHAVKSRKQAVAIGLSKARRAGVEVPSRGRAKKRTTKKTTTTSSRVGPRKRSGPAKTKLPAGARKAAPKKRAKPGAKKRAGARRARQS